MTSAGFVLVKATPTHVLVLYCDLYMYRPITHCEHGAGMNVEAIGLLTKSAIYIIIYALASSPETNYGPWEIWDRFV